MGRCKTKEEFILEANKIYGLQYDYSEVKYIRIPYYKNEIDQLILDNFNIPLWI